MRSTWPTSLTAALALTTLACTALSDTPAATAPATQSVTTKDVNLTVAILDFDAPTTAGAGDTGKQIAEAITALISGTKGITLVDRASIHKTLAEHELNLTGAVDPAKAIAIGKLVGAKILVTGKVFTLGKATFITAKIIGTETTLVEGVLVKGKEDEDVGALAATMAEKLAKQLVASGPTLVNTDSGDGVKFAALRATLLKMKLPTVSVSISEEHRGEAKKPADPAVESEIKSMLQECGFKVLDPEKTPAAEIDYKITGAAFSEYSARIGNLVSCAGRTEINVTSRTDAKIVLTGVTTQRGVDLAENIAGKAALQKAGRIIGLQILEHFANAPAATGPAPK